MGNLRLPGPTVSPSDMPSSFPRMIARRSPLVARLRDVLPVDAMIDDPTEARSSVRCLNSLSLMTHDCGTEVGKRPMVHRLANQQHQHPIRHEMTRSDRTESVQLALAHQLQHHDKPSNRRGFAVLALMVSTLLERHRWALECCSLSPLLSWRLQRTSKTLRAPKNDAICSA